MSESDSDHDANYKTPVKRRKVDEERSRHKSSRSHLSTSSLSHSLNESPKTDRHGDVSVGYYSSPATTPVGRDNKAGWYDIHDKHVQQAALSKSEIVLCGDSIVAGLSRYPNIWRKYFRPLKALNMGIGGDRTQHVLWRAENINLPTTAYCVIIHCGTNNIDRDSARDISEGIVSVGLAFQERKPGLKIIVTGLLPRDLEVTYRREKIAQTNKHLKRFCRKLSDFYYMKQDRDWTLYNGKLDESLYYTDHLHLVEPGNEKFAKSIIATWYRVKENTLVYSDDEEEGDDYDFIRERKIGEIRSSRGHSPKHPTNSHRKRKRSNSNDRGSPAKVHRSPYKWKHSDDSNTGSRWSAARKWSQILKTENGADSPRNRGEQASEKSLEDKVEGTAKSIDISLDSEKRLAARRAKFGIVDSSPKSSERSLKTLDTKSRTEIRKTLVSPSALVRKIQSSQAKARQELSQKKQKSRQERRSLVGYDSPSSSQEDVPTTKSPTKIKKFFSDYASGSESE